MVLHFWRDGKSRTLEYRTMNFAFVKGQGTTPSTESIDQEKSAVVAPKNHPCDETNVREHLSQEVEFQFTDEISAAMLFDIIAIARERSALLENLKIALIEKDSDKVKRLARTLCGLPEE
jgi:hypothetical protein